MRLEQITHENRDRINEFIMRHWFTTEMVIRGEIVDMTAVDGLFIADERDIIGLITYRTDEGVLEITSLDSLREDQGIGTALLNAVIDKAKELRCTKIVLITTNDNINALRFYQKRGFDMTCLYHNAVDRSRKIKPEIPLIGEHSIPIRHEIELEMIL